MKIVAHFVDGSLVKGTTTDFSQSRDSFHVREHSSGENREIRTSSLKAIFFVKSFDGDKKRIERTDAERTGYGKKIRVRFKDGETLFGYTTAYSPGRPAFFLFPADAASNNERIFVLEHATEQIVV